jgi:hypothetical protein
MIAIVIGAMLASTIPSAAHGTLGAYLQHSLHLRVDAQHIDITLDVTFFEEPSARERAKMDTNADGRITPAEVESYVKQRASGFYGEVKLSVGGHEVSLVPLYEPEIVLANEKTDALAHHHLRLSFFAETPPDLKANDRIVVDDLLWQDLKSLRTQEVKGDDGCELLPETPNHSGTSRELHRGSSRFAFRCVKPPARKAEASHQGKPIPSKNRH